MGVERGTPAPCWVEEYNDTTKTHAALAKRKSEAVGTANHRATGRQTSASRAECGKVADNSLNRSMANRGMGQQGMGQQGMEYGQQGQPGGQQMGRQGQTGGQQLTQPGGQFDDQLPGEMRVALEDFEKAAKVCDWCADKCMDRRRQIANAFGSVGTSPTSER